MEEVGTVITVPIKDADIWAGMEVLLCVGGNVIDIVKVDHMTIQGHYYVVGNNTACAMSDDMYLAYMYVKSKNGDLYKIKFNQWRSLIKSKIINSGRAVIYELLPSTFSTGYYSKLCISCGAYFSGNKKQQDCEECAEANRYAMIKLEELPKRAKRKRTIIRHGSI